jgi:hypothetical protein
MRESPEDTGGKQALTRFKPGQSGNPKGRPKGARSRLGEQFIQPLADDFEEHGIGAVRQVRVRDPVAYIKVIKDTLPREVLVKAFTAHATIDLTALEESQGRLAAYRYARDMIGTPLEAVDEGVLVTDAWNASDD